MARKLLAEKFPDWHPFLQLCETAQRAETEELRFQAAKEVTGYLMPKLKAVEHTGADGGPFVVVQAAGDDEL